MSHAVTLYGIKTCSTVKKAQSWLSENHIEVVYHDFRKDGLDETLLKNWIDNLGWQKLLNKSSMTFRKLPDHEKQDIDLEKAYRLMLSHPTLIRRPVLTYDAEILVGFKPDMYQELFS